MALTPVSDPHEAPRGLVRGLLLSNAKTQLGLWQFVLDTTQADCGSDGDANNP